MLKRILAAMFGAVLFGVLVPLGYLVLFSIPESLMILGGIVFAGITLGAALGFAFPMVFGFVFEMAFDI